MICSIAIIIIGAKISSTSVLVLGIISTVTQAIAGIIKAVND